MKKFMLRSCGHGKVTIPCHLRDDARGRRFVRWLMTFFVVFGVSLTAKAQPLPVVYQGLTNSSLGNATLAVSGSQLVVSNLGSSGQDGVSIALPGNLSALETHWQALDA
ncbi:MAG: hypothetical protein ABSC03_19510, partial [Verrucomicrobiota bacterium]